MFSLLGEGDLANCCAAEAGKKDDLVERELSAGEGMGGLLDELTGLSVRIQGTEGRLLVAEDSMVDVALAGSCGSS